jgi:hypothetical protein
VDGAPGTPSAKLMNEEGGHTDHSLRIEVSTASLQIGAYRQSNDSLAR